MLQLLQPDPGEGATLEQIIFILFLINVSTTTTARAHVVDAARASSIVRRASAVLRSGCYC
jgi:hypothetical protein